MSMKLEDKFHELPEQHRALLVVMFLLVVAGVLYGMFFLRPQWKAFSELVSEHASVDKKLSDSSWPKDSARLNSLLQSYQQKLVGMKKSVKDGDAAVPSLFAADTRDLGLQDKAELVMKHATSMFDQNIINAYGDATNFVTKASQTEYKDLYDRTDSMLQGMRVVLEPSIFGMDESTAEPEKYQMILKLWTVQEVVRRARDNNLRVANDPSLTRAGLGRPSKISVLPMISYSLDPQDKEPYLLEFPVRLQVEGTMDNFIKFVQSLQTEECFLPMKQMELLAEQPQPALQILVDPDGTVNRVFKTPRGEVKRPTGENGLLELRNITAVVVCSSFFRPTPGTPVRSSRRQVIEPKPAGI